MRTCTPSALICRAICATISRRARPHVCARTAPRSAPATFPTRNHRRAQGVMQMRHVEPSPPAGAEHSRTTRAAQARRRIPPRSRALGRRGSGGSGCTENSARGLPEANGPTAAALLPWRLHDGPSTIKHLAALRAAVSFPRALQPKGRKRKPGSRRRGQAATATALTHARMFWRSRFGVPSLSGTICTPAAIAHRAQRVSHAVRRASAATRARARPCGGRRPCLPQGEAVQIDDIAIVHLEQPCSHTNGLARKHVLAGGAPSAACPTGP